ncbi:MAG: NADH-quinone oxidoreductase subunit N [Planctomycetota bacterium]|jgi:NADH-quinone oxidoreductase subunit N|nr:NADH-quinone oxidoreductase subunit N [Planctomycetota bacterium]
MLLGLTPDILVVATALVVLVLESVAPKPWRTRAIVLSAGLGCVLAAVAMISLGDGEGSVAGYTLRPWATPLRLTAVLSVLMSLLMIPSQLDHDNRRMRRLVTPGVAVFMLLASLAGTCSLAGANDMVAFIVSLELATIPLFALVALFQDGESSEAGLKFLLTGALATGLLVFGMSYCYGAGGAVDFPGLAAGLDGPLAVTGALLMVLAILFKLSAAPMHVWAPDVYDGAPNAVASYLASGSKATGLIALLLLWEGPFVHLHEQLRPLLITTAIASMVIGNLGALRQTRLRRFMAWSSIAQVGFFLLAVGTGLDGVLAISFYAVVYALSNGLAFLVFDCLGESRPPTMPALRGLSKQSPALALALTLAVFSLAGIPPLAGFLGKFALLLAPAREGMYLLVLIGALNGLVGLYYYLRVVREAYMVEPETRPDDLRLDLPQRLGVLLCAVAILGFGIWPGVHNWIAGLLGLV